MSLPQFVAMGFFAVALSSSIVFNAVCWTVLSFAASQASPLYDEHQVSNGSSSMPLVADYFAEVRRDLTRVKWGHGINSKAQLNESLLGKDMMIECDVLMGTIVDDESGNRMPVMAHPPAKTSDLSFEEFIDIVIRSGKRKGVKIDFKDFEAVEPCLSHIRSRATEITFPLFINADIIAGPVESTTAPLNATQFLGLATQYVPNSVLSVGWTTRFGPDVTSWPIKFVNAGNYSFAHVKKMRDILQKSNVRQPVTFPVRAGLSTSTESQKNLLWLLDQVPGSTVTIWGGAFDTVDVKGLVEFIARVGKHRTYLDVPSGLNCEVRHFNENEND